jgi:hypothetical protein
MQELCQVRNICAPNYAIGITKRRKLLCPKYLACAILAHDACAKMDTSFCSRGAHLRMRIAMIMPLAFDVYGDHSYCIEVRGGAGTGVCAYAYAGARRCVRVHRCACAQACVCVCVCVRKCVHRCVWVYASRGGDRGV